MRGLLILFLLPALLSAQVINPDRTVDWSRAGIQKTISSPSKVLNIKDFGATGNGIQDDSQFLISAINSLNERPGIIYFPKGIYYFNSSIMLKSGVILQGESADSTTLNFNLSGADRNCINIIEENQNILYTTVISGFQKESYSITTSESINTKAGDYIEIRQKNGTWDTNPADWAKFSVGQVLKVFAVSGKEIYFENPIRIDYDSSLNVKCRIINPISNCGVECLKITRSDFSNGGHNIYLQNAIDCWIKGVESKFSNSSHIMLDRCSSVEISGSYIHDAFAYDGVNTHGYGVTLSNHTGECLIENNIFKHLRHSISVKHGANGNVIAYNYSTDPYRVESPHDGGADISVHGHYAYANLFEGNIVQTIHIDQAWGPSGPFNTFFRNRIDLYGIIVTNGIVDSESQNFVGNEITNLYFPYGNFLLGGRDHFLYRNNIRGTIHPEETDELVDKSYYRNSAPLYWHNSSWPSIGISEILGSGTNPAEIRFKESKSLMVCTPAPTFTGITSGENTKNENIFFAVPNPFNMDFEINFNAVTNKKSILRLYDINGKLMLEQAITMKPGLNKLEFKAASQLAPGIYFLRMENDYCKIVKIAY